MKTINRVSQLQAEQFVNTHYGSQVTKVELTYPAGKRIEYFKAGNCVASYVTRFNLLEYFTKH